MYFYTNDENTIKEEYNNVDIDDISLIPNIYNVGTNSAIYTFNQGDEFNVIVKNTNVTVAERLFNTFTLYINSTSIPRVYINYGGIISAEKYKDAEV